MFRKTQLEILTTKHIADTVFKIMEEQSSLSRTGGVVLKMQQTNPKLKAMIMKLKVGQNHENANTCSYKEETKELWQNTEANEKNLKTRLLYTLRIININENSLE